MEKSNPTEYIYKNASEHADKIIEAILPKFREALMEAYAKGFANATTLSMNYNKQHNK